MGLSKKSSEEYAKLLYLEGNLTQKEIAKRCEVSEKTISNWVNKFGWNEVKVSLITLKDSQLKRLYQQLNKMTTFIDEQQDSMPSAKDVDAQVKLVSAIRQFETESNIAEIMDIAQKFCRFVKDFDLPFAQQAAEYFDQFIQTKM